MNMREQILLVADQYGEAVKLGRGRISTIVLNRGSKLDDIAKGGDLVTASFEKAMQWFSDHWPDAYPWPEGVERPLRNPIPEAAE